MSMSYDKQLGYCRALLRGKLRQRGAWSPAGLPTAPVLPSHADCTRPGTGEPCLPVLAMP